MVWRRDVLPDVFDELPMQRKERQIAEVLWSHTPYFVTVERIMLRVYGMEDDAPTDNAVRVAVWKMRRKLPAGFVIESRRHDGYRMIRS